MERMKESLILKPKPTKVIIETNAVPLSTDSPSTAPASNPQRSAQKHYWTREEVLGY
jgi:hypothetical protein